METKNKKVILLGTAGSLVDTPWGKHDKYDYWACGSVISHVVSKDKQMDAIFELHGREYWNVENVKKLYKEYNSKFPKSLVYMQEHNKEIKGSLEYPLEDIKNMAGHYLLKKYQTSTISYMIAMAILKGYEQILMYGCHMSSDEEEYSRQRACCEAWLNFGLGRGIDYWLTPDTDIMKCSYMYGYDGDKAIYLKLCGIHVGVKNALKEYEGKYQKAWDEYNQQKGGDIFCEKFKRIIRE